MRGCEVARLRGSRFEVARLRGSRLRGCEVVRFKIFHIPSDDIFLDSFVCTNGEVRGSRLRGLRFEVARFEVRACQVESLMIKLPGFI